MFYKKEFIQTFQLSTENDTIVKFAENLEFTVPKLDHGEGWYQLKDVKGDFEITRFKTIYDDGDEYPCSFDKSNHKLYCYRHVFTYAICITANIEMEEMCVVNYCIPSARLKFLECGKFIKSEIVLPGYADLKFIYYVKKINGTSKNDIEIFIENPYAGLKIQGKEGDFKIVESSSNAVDLVLSFGFDPSVLITTPAAAEDDEEEDATDNAADQASVSETQLEQNEPSQASVVDESRPESSTKLQTIGSNKLFADVFFVSSDGTKIASHRCILAGSSNILMPIFKESTEIPVQIDADDFVADTIESALNFLYEKPDAINGKEMDVFKFAAKYGIQDLIDACCSFFEAAVDPSNVCDFIQIAYSNNFEELKQKCLKVMVEKKNEIDAAKKRALPKDILLDAYCL